MNTRTISILAAGCLLATAADALAHIQITYPPQRTSSQKTGPCGAAGSTRGDTVTVLAPGSTITVRWDETIQHPSHYRISFDMDGDDDFVDPADYDERYSNDAVLVDDIGDESGGTPLPYEQTITLPDVECDNCTLQLVQVMYDKPPYGDGNDLYYQCADLVLTRDPGTIPDAGPGGGPGGGSDAGPGAPDDDGGGCQAAGGRAGSSAGLVLLALALAPIVSRGRRRSRQRHPA